MRTLIVLPTYNERENLTLLLPELLDLPVDICVVDDNSPDGTGKIADDWAAREPSIRVVHRAGKLGLGTAYITGFDCALANGYDAALTMDADFSHHPKYVPSLLDAIQRADLVIGSRYVSWGEVRYPIHRRFLSRTANAIARNLLRLNARDCTAGFRVYRAEVLRAIPLNRIFSNGYSFLVEMLWHVQSRGYKICEVPIVFEDRAHGESKISSNEIFKAIYTIARLAVTRP
jgi:glycosyltransferase involved in cell wall biosynthesis